MLPRYIICLNTRSLTLPVFKILYKHCLLIPYPAAISCNPVFLRSDNNFRCCFCVSFFALPFFILLK